MEPEPERVALPRLAVMWKDLVPLTRIERLTELTLCLPWLAASLGLYAVGGWWVLPGGVCSFYFFLTGLRTSHNAQHGNIGIGRRGHDLVLLTLSTLMLASMHAIRTTHLHHHRHCLDEDEVESSTARLAWWRAMLAGPAFIVRLHLTAWRIAKPLTRRWIAAELALAGCVIVAAVAFATLACLRWHVLAMLGGECLTGFFAVWTVHHGCVDEQPIGRTVRGRLLNRLSYGMFLHAEHHLCPGVPTAHLPELAQRLDEAGADVAAHRVIALPRVPGMPGETTATGSMPELGAAA